MSKLLALLTLVVVVEASVVQHVDVVQVENLRVGAGEEFFQILVLNIQALLREVGVDRLFFHLHLLQGFFHEAVALPHVLAQAAEVEIALVALVFFALVDVPVNLVLGLVLQAVLLRDELFAALRTREGLVLGVLLFVALEVAYLCRRHSYLSKGDIALDAAVGFHAGVDTVVLLQRGVLAEALVALFTSNMKVRSLTIHKASPPCESACAPARFALI